LVVAEMVVVTQVEAHLQRVEQILVAVAVVEILIQIQNQVGLAMPQLDII
jgi:hypothetical protein